MKCFCASAPAVAELASHANWAQEFLAHEQSQSQSHGSGDFDAVVPIQRNAPISSLRYGGAMMPAAAHHRPFQHW